MQKESAYQQSRGSPSSDAFIHLGAAICFFFVTTVNCLQECAFLVHEEGLPCVERERNSILIINSFNPRVSSLTSRALCVGLALRVSSLYEVRWKKLHNTRAAQPPPAAPRPPTPLPLLRSHRTALELGLNAGTL